MSRPCMTIFLVAATLVIAATGCSNNSNTVSSRQAAVNLVGSKQGQAVGFADVDGDGFEDKIVGAPYAASASSLGSVLVYRGSASDFSPTNSAIFQGGDTFGYAIVNMGDVDGDGQADFAISAIHGSGDNAGDTSLSGTVTIYKGGGNGQILKKLSGEGPMDKFGCSLAAGDLNGDGTPDLIVGAPFNTKDPALYQSGAVYVYFGPDFTSHVALYGSKANSGLGLAVAAGKVNSSVGAADDLLIMAGSYTGTKVLVYFGGAGFAPAVNAPDITLTSVSSGFGKSIAVIGDIDNDGKGEIAVGAPNSVVGVYRDTGSIYLMRGSATGSINLDAATPPASLLVRINGPGFFSRFGAVVLALGDIDGDGMPDFAVGSPMADVNTISGQHILSGKVYLFRGKDISGSATLSASTVFEGEIRDQQFGASLARSSSKMLLIGAPRSNMDTGGVQMLDPATGQAVPGGSSGGATGSSGDCH